MKSIDFRMKVLYWNYWKMLFWNAK